MSHYTTQIRYICENLSGLTDSAGYADVNKVIKKARKKIFTFDYPIFDADYKPLLETKILKHYYTREIGLESFGLWQLNLDRVMNEIMPLYNQYYESALIKFNPMHDTDLYVKRDDERVDRTDEVQDNNTNNDVAGRGHGSSNLTAGNTDWNYNSDTPQGTVGNLDSLTYLTDAVKTTGDSHQDTTSDNDYSENRDIIEKRKRGEDFRTVDDYLEHVAGKSAGGKSFSEMLNAYRETFLNIDMMVINDTEMRNLFMGLWG